MDKEELIKLLEREVESIHYGKKNIKISEPLTYDWLEQREIQLRGILNEFKQLNEVPVKRSELIDFAQFIIDDNPSEKWYPAEIIVDNYLKSINSSEA